MTNLAIHGMEFIALISLIAIIFMPSYILRRTDLIVDRIEFYLLIYLTSFMGAYVGVMLIYVIQTYLI